MFSRLSDLTIPSLYFIPPRIYTPTQLITLSHLTSPTQSSQPLINSKLIKSKMGKFSQAQRTGQKITAFFILPTFVFFLICSISVPVTPLAFLSYRLSGTKALTVGMWGSCTFDIAANGALTNRNCTRPTVPFLVVSDSFELNCRPKKAKKMNPPLILLNSPALNRI